MSKKTAAHRKPTKPPKLVDRGVAFLLTAGLITCVVAVLIQLTIKDRWSFVAPVFYVLPLHVVSGIFLVLAFIWQRKKDRRRAFLHGALSFVALLLFVQTSWHPRSAAATGSASGAEAEAASPVRIVSWNLFHGRLGGKNAIADLAALEPDIAGLVECGDLTDETALWGRALPGYTIVPFGGGIAVATRGTVRSPKLIRLGERSRVARCDIELEGRSLRLFVVDLDPNPFRNKRPCFEKLARVCTATDADTPVIILGDFNTPSSSTCFDGLRSRFREAITERGGGFGFTWPSPLPLWNLDQVWLDAGWRTLEWNNPATIRSDHRALVVDVVARHD